jgi:hypothetical protein
MTNDATRRVVSLFCNAQVTKAAEKIEKRGERPDERTYRIRQSGRIRLGRGSVDS